MDVDNDFNRIVYSFSACQLSITANQICGSRQKCDKFQPLAPCSSSPPLLSISWRRESSLNEVVMGKGGS